jgi:hypothetical protein
MPRQTYRRLRAHKHAFGLLALACLIVSFCLSSIGSASTSVGPTGNDPRPFPRTFHIWGGAPSNYTKYDFVVGYGSWPLASLRAADPGALFLVNPMLDPSNPDWTQRKGVAVTYGGANTFGGTTDTVVDGNAANLGTIPAWNSYWDTMYKPDGSLALINNGSSGELGWNLTRTDTAEKTAKIFAYGAKLVKTYSNGWDGVWSDNWIYRIGASYFYGSNLDTNRDRVADNMSQVKYDWWNGLTLVGQRVRQYLPGKIVGGNGASTLEGLTPGSDPNGPYKASNAALIEVLETYTARADTFLTTVQSYLGYSDPYGMARYFTTMHDLPGGQSDYKSMRWGLSLATIAGAYYEAYASSHDDAFWYDEYDGGSLHKRGWLGSPVTAATKLSNGVWRRYFSNGVVLNNSTTAAQTVSLGGTYRRLSGSQAPTVNNGASVTSVTIPSGDGLFLVGANAAPTSAPANATLPTISGTAASGSSLAASTGTWNNAPTSFTYQWRRCDDTGANCAAVSGATATGYVLTATDVDKTMRVAVTATNAVGSSTAVSAASDVVTAGSTTTTPPPTTTTTSFDVASSIASGATLAGNVSWNATPNAAAAKVEFYVDGALRWTENLAPYTYGGDGATWDTTKETSGSHALSVKAYATDGRVATQGATVSISNGTLPSWSTVSSISNGQTLTGNVSWTAGVSGLSTSSVSRVDFSIDGTLKWTEQLSPYVFNGDGGTLATTTLSNGSHTFSVKVTTTSGTSSTTSATATVSNGSTPPPPPPPAPTGSAPANTAPPTISGTTQVGQTLSGTAGTWSGSPTSYVYQWQRCDSGGANCVAVSGASSQTYGLTTSDSGATMRFKVTASNATGSASATSAQTAVVTSPAAPPPPPSGTLTVTNSMQNQTTISGNVTWTATVSGVPLSSVAKVEFLIDGVVVWTDTASPYVCMGDGKQFPTATLSNGWHMFTVKATTTTGAVDLDWERVKIRN